MGFRFRVPGSGVSYRSRWHPLGPPGERLGNALVGTVVLVIFALILAVLFLPYERYL